MLELDLATPDDGSGTVGTPGPLWANKINDALNALNVGKSDVGAGGALGKIVAPGNPALALGEVIAIGRALGLPPGINTAVLIGDGAPNYENVIGGILANVNGPSSNIPPGGPGTGAGALGASPNGSWNVILGGYDNVTNGWATVILGFHNKVGGGANHITISGGSIHEVAGLVQHAVISGGTINKINAGADYAVVGGGTFNEASAIYAVVAGGLSNKATARASLVLGGENNQATASYAVVVGGFSTVASGSSSLAAGQSNVASGGWSVVAGRDNLASNEAAVATGRGAVASVPGERAHSSSVFASQGDAQHRQFIMRRQTTDATPSGLFANAAATYPMLMPANSTWTFSALVTARRTDAAGESAGYRIEGVVDRQATGSSIAFVGTPTVTVLAEDNATWDCGITVDTSNGSMVINVKGEAGKTVRWVAQVDVIQVTN